MAREVLILVIGSLLAVPLFCLLPNKFRWDALAIWSALVIGCTAPIALVWLLCTATGTIAVLRHMHRLQQPGVLVATWALILVVALLVLREIETLLLVGAAYFTLRNLHVLLDGWMNPKAQPSLRTMLRYQFFIPVIVAGPIHRIDVFKRSCERRRFDLADLACGAERALLGLASALVVGIILRNVLLSVEQTSLIPESFAKDWLHSAIQWIQLYFIFAGYSSFAIGISLMLGIKIEENFNHPWRAKNLLDFWQRWHITLSLWCRDYVFQPITALTRKPIIGLAAAMLTIGIWHESSAYYILWAM